MSLPAPSWLSAFAAVTRFSLLRIARSRRAVIAVISVVVLVAAVALSRGLGDQTAGDAWDSALEYGLLGFVGYLIPFLFHASSFSEEHEDRTLTYLLVRPIPSSALVTGKFAAAALASVSVALATVLLLFAASYVGGAGYALAEPMALARACLATSLLVLGHGAIASAYSTITPEQTTPVTVVHFALLELLPPKAGGVLPLLSMHQHAMDLALIGRTAGDDSGPPLLPVWGSTGYILAYAAFFLLLACVIASGREYRFSKS
jgi:ABC-type transport system involved in multi-copper enzyme maturation permease subunit